MSDREFINQLKEDCSHNIKELEKIITRLYKEPYPDYHALGRFEGKLEFDQDVYALIQEHLMEE